MKRLYENPFWEIVWFDEEDDLLTLSLETQADPFGSGNKPSWLGGDVNE